MSLESAQNRHDKTMKKRKKAANKSDWSSASLPRGTFGVIQISNKKPQWRDRKLQVRAGIKVFKSTTPLRLGRE